MKKTVMLEHIKNGFLRVKSLVSELTTIVIDTIEELDNDKLDKISSVSVSIHASGWKSDNNIYPKYYDINAGGVTKNDIAEVVIAPESLSTVKECGLCPTCETLVDNIRIRAANVPTMDINAEYWIMNGRKEA